jgi:hypothetical protein
MRSNRTINRCVLTMPAVILILLAPAWAHSPLFPRSNNSLQFAYSIRDPLKSWAAYSELSEPGDAAFYQMEAQIGDRIRIMLFTAQDPKLSKFLPSIRVMKPGAINPGENMPAERVLASQEGRIPARATYEPFTSTWYYQLANIDVTASESGIYQFMISESANCNGRYGVVVGYKEQWTLWELVLLPMSILKIYLWEGQNFFVVLLPVVLVSLIGGLLFMKRASRGKPPKGFPQWFAAFSGLFFLGWIAIIVLQMLLAFRHTGASTHAFITAIVALIPALLATVILIFALGVRERITFIWRIALFVAGCLGLVLYAGMFVGPVLALAAALTPQKLPIASTTRHTILQ